MRYHGIGTDPFEFAVEPVAPPFAPSAFARPAPDPEPVQAPKRLAGPIFPAPGWHVGPAVYASGYGAADASDDTGVWASLSTGTKIGLGVTGVLALGAIGLAIGAFKAKPKARKNPTKAKHRRNGAKHNPKKVYDLYIYEGDDTRFAGTFGSAKAALNVAPNGNAEIRIRYGNEGKWDADTYAYVTSRGTLDLTGNDRLPAGRTR